MIKDEINENGKLELIGIVCYVCAGEGHIATDCPQFGDIKGNLNNKKKWRKGAQAIIEAVKASPDIGFDKAEIAEKSSSETSSENENQDHVDKLRMGEAGQKIAVERLSFADKQQKFK